MNAKNERYRIMLNPRLNGKAQAAEMIKEAYLANGKSVAEMKPDGTWLITRPAVEGLEQGETSE